MKLSFQSGFVSPETNVKYLVIYNKKIQHGLQKHIEQIEDNLT